MTAWSKFQSDIFAHVEGDNGNLIVEAVAGSGKTTTIVEATKRCGDARVIFLAFNKAIATELKSRGVNARTFHSLVFMPALNLRKQRDASPDKMYDLTDSDAGHWGSEDAFLYRNFVRKLVGLAKQTGIGCLVDDTEDEWVAIADHHDMELENEAADFATAIEWSRKFLRISNASSMVDFDDMLYLVVKEGVALPKFDWVFVDEAQDTNAIQRAILRKIMRPNSRLVAVGDPAQAIYGFRGADSDSLGLIASEFNATTLPLSVSYRCSQSVVNYARQWVSHILPADTAPEGTVDIMGDWSLDMLEPRDLVVCRVTKPLIALGYKMLKARKPVRILGKEIGDGLIKLIEKQKAKGIDRLVEKLEKFRSREIEKAVAAKKPGKAAAVADKVDAILCLIESMDENDRTVPALVTTIRALFEDVRNATTLCTIHKSKGLEADRVFWLNRSACPSPWARQPWQQQQEKNLCYVAATRAKTALVIVEDERLTTDKPKAAKVEA